MEPIRVMISENCGAFATLLSQRLEMYPDIRVIGVVGNGSDTLRMLPLLKPDVLLLDIVMPQLDGLEVLRQMRLAGIDTTTYVISALSSDDMVRRALALGARYYFVKPFSTDSMAKCICEAHILH